MPQPELTVIIPTHNRRVLLARTLHSVLAQQQVDLVVVVVDDGGSDGTAAAVESRGDRRVSVVRHEQARGVSAARNSGIARAETPWLAFVDDDDLWAPDKLRSQLAALAADPAAQWSCTGSVNVDERCVRSWWAEPPEQADVADLLLGRNVIPGGGSGVVASRALTEQVGGFDEALSNLADWDFYIRLGLQAPLASVSRPLLGYLVHPLGMAHNVQRSAREYQYLEVKYERERQRRGVALERGDWLHYLSGLASNGGQRLTAARMHAELALRHHRWRSLRSVAADLAPQQVRRAWSTRHSPPAMPPGWEEQVERWLAPYRQGWLD